MANTGILYRIALICIIPLFLSSCGEDDLKKAATLSSKKALLSKDRSLDVDITFSDSAVVKAKGLAPVLDQVNPSTGSKYQEMPKGVKITFYDPLLKVTGTLVSDYAIRKETEQLTIFRKNVVVVRNNMTFNTEEITWDQRKKMFFSPKGIITNPDGTVYNATNFRAPEDFSTFDSELGAGTTYVKGDLTP
jgi:hypothetical protein